MSFEKPFTMDVIRLNIYKYIGIGNDLNKLSQVSYLCLQNLSYNKTKYKFKIEIITYIRKTYDVRKLWNIAANVKVVKRIFDRKLPRD